MPTAVIIDDEKRARNVLCTLLKENVADIEILDEAEDVPGGVRAINKHKPDIVFLDVEMPGYNGFQLLNFFEQINFSIIFTTAYSEYAVQAFQVSAVDYLLKPIQIDALQKAVEKAKSLARNNNTDKYDTLKSNVGGNGIQKIALPVSNGLMFVPLSDLELVEADGSYSHFVLKNGEKIMVSKRLKEFESALLNSQKFFRPHRSYIVNIDSIKQYVKSDGGYLLMQNGAQVSLSREMRDEFLQVIGEKS